MGVKEDNRIPNQLFLKLLGYKISLNFHKSKLNGSLCEKLHSRFLLGRQIFFYLN